MNRLVLVGNGFDLAHNMETSYKSFIYWYMKKCFFVANSRVVYEDDLIVISPTNRYFKTDEDLDTFIQRYLRNFKTKKKVATITYSFEERPISNEMFSIKFKTPLLELLLDRCVGARWVDVESEYYNLLKGVLQMKTELEKEIYLRNLNAALGTLIKKLEVYLLEVEEKDKPYIDLYEQILKSQILSHDLYPKGQQGNQYPNETRLLNFNYTNTLSQYAQSTATTTVGITHIHGKLADKANKLIFGFGDELDSAYKQMEDDSAVDGYFEYIKSFWYLRTSNYRDLVDFLDSNEYQVLVLGHSCGLSDRTMLQMIFEHKNCLSVKIYYHEDDAGDNYVNITHNIARHFTDKDMMRKKIVAKDKSFKMPQFNEIVSPV